MEVCQFCDSPIKNIRVCYAMENRIDIVLHYYNRKLIYRVNFDTQQMNTETKNNLLNLLYYVYSYEYVNLILFISSCYVYTRLNLLTNSSNLTSSSTPITPIDTSEKKIKNGSDLIFEAVLTLKNAIDNINSKFQYGHAFIQPEKHYCQVKLTDLSDLSDFTDYFCINKLLVSARYCQSIGYKKICIINWDYTCQNHTEYLLNTRNFSDISLINILNYNNNIYTGTGPIVSDNILQIPFHTPSDNNSLILNDVYLKLFSDKITPFITQINPDFIIVSNNLNEHDKHFVDNFFFQSISLFLSFHKPLLFVLESHYDVNIIRTISEKFISEFKKNF